MRRVKILLMALVAGGAFWCLVDGGAEVRAEGAAPEITISESEHNGSLATVDLSKDGTVATIDFSYTITPSKVGTYEVYVGTESATLTGKDHYTENSDAKLTSMTLNSALGAKQWGYRTSALVPASSTPTIDDNTVPYKPMTVVDNSTKTYGEKMKDTSSNTTISGNNATKLKVEVAAKGDATLPADKYQGKIILSVVATPKTTLDFFSVTNFSEMSTDACESVKTPTNTASGYATTMAQVDANVSGDKTTMIPRIVVEDTRGSSKKYLVSKLADGRCWMTQNLALAGDTVITAEDSDITESQYNVTSPKRGYKLPSSNTAGFNDNTAQHMYNGSHTDGAPDNKDASNTGSYYSWLTATAGSGSTYTQNSDQYKNASASICPKGWKLPSSFDGSSSANGDFYKLYTTAYSSNFNSGFNRAWLNTTATLSTSTTFSSLVGAYGNGSLSYGGKGSYWWSSTVFSSTNAYSMNEDRSRVYPQNYSSRYNGFSVRCVFAG